MGGGRKESGKQGRKRVSNGRRKRTEMIEKQRKKRKRRRGGKAVARLKGGRVLTRVQETWGRVEKVAGLG